MLRPGDCAYFDDIFTHVDVDGTVRHFNATKMRRAVEKGDILLDAMEVAIDPSFAEFILLNRGIEEPKVRRLCEPYLSAPLLHVEFPDTVLLVDGHHRYVRLYREGRAYYNAYIVKGGHWQQFLVDIG